ncbi:MAG: hypothetical protein FJX25_17375 [Alphaproteobacteria bacterium]|nr:hypothetical protein [Alphaproteobacteria bacterium]
MARQERHSVSSPRLPKRRMTVPAAGFSEGSAGILVMRMARMPVSITDDASSETVRLVVAPPLRVTPVNRRFFRGVPSEEAQGQEE